MAKKSETLAQREKAQRDLLELKKMQAGTIDPGPKPSEEAVLPSTFKEKRENFFYHYKYVVLLCAFLLVVAIVLIADLIGKVHYDSKVVVFSYDTAFSLHNEKISEYFEQFYEDVNENGKVEIAALDCSINPDQTNEMNSAKIMQMQAVLATESDALIYLLDEETIQYYENALGDVELFDREKMVVLKDDFYDFIKTGGISVPKTQLYAAMRKVEGTTLDGDNKEAYDAALKVMEKLRAAGEQ